MTDRTLPLAGVRVVDMADEKAELCGRILADLGAEVIRVEPPDGGVSRTLPPFAPDGETSLYFAVRNANKRGLVLDLSEAADRAVLEQLLAGSDVWIDTTRPGALADVGLDPLEASRRHPHLVVTTITDFGQTGPYRDHVATEPVMIAMSGMLFRSGTPDRPPLLPPGALSYDVTGVSAAFATLAALIRQRAIGWGSHIDMSVLEAAGQCSDWSLPNWSVASRPGGYYTEIRAGSGIVYPLYPCKDGYVRMIVLSPRQWHALREWIGDPDWLQEPEYDGLLGRMGIQDILENLYVEHFSQYDMAELADEGQRRGIVITPALGPDEVLRTPHFVERKTFIETEVAPGLSGPIHAGFFEWQGERAGVRHRAPTVDEHGAAIREAAAAVAAKPAPAGERPAPSHPLAGLRVLDFGIGGVGVEASRLLGEYGADVIKIETRTYPDFIRVIAGSEMSPSFASSSRSKRSFGVNCKTEEGLAVLKRLVQTADVLVENGSTGTMADMGLSWDECRALNPRLIMVSSQLMGATGPWASWIGYGPSTRTVAGMTYLWNFEEGGMPPGSGAIYPDHLVGRMCAVGALAGLLGRGRDGDGAHVEVAQVETTIGLMADLFLKAGLAPGSVQPQGNSSERGTPWGLFPTEGDQQWIAITVRSDDEWARLRTAMGDPAWAAEEAYGHAAGRRAGRVELERQLAEWTAGFEGRALTTLLQHHGVPAGFMMYASQVTSDPHLQARGYPIEIDQPGTGSMVLEGAAFLSPDIQPPITFPAPGLGQHTRDVARELLGLGDDEIDKLVANGALEEELAK